jgi:D-serine deaminase-like pyridoxal phosphate-dependent protein
MDAGQLALGAATPDQVALTVRATVVSDAVPGQVVLDAGAKLLGMDRPAFVDGHGLLPDYPEARITRIWEHHGVVEIPDGAARPRLGERVTVVPNHVCATVNLVDELVAGAEVWPVTARGRNT